MYSYQTNSTLKVYSELYIGLRDQGKDQCQLGFATPYETNAAGRKRQETVDKWVGTKQVPVMVDGQHMVDENGRPKYTPADMSSHKKVVKNDPREGWKVTDDVKRVYFGGGNVVWRVFDPHGYELEISSANLMALIQVAGVAAGGVIPGKCVLGRDSSGINVLLHEESSEYKTSIKNAENLKKAANQISRTTKTPGKIYLLQNGSSAVFIGKVHVCIKKELPAPEQPGYSYTPVDLAPVKFDSTVPYKANHPIYELARHQYIVLPSVEYEAVITIQDGNMADDMVLYKKAPCVSEIGSIDLPEINDTFLNAQNSTFAAATNYDQICSISLAPIVNPEFCLNPWTDQLFDEALASITESPYSQLVKAGFSAYRKPTLRHMLSRRDIYYVIGQDLCHDLFPAYKIAEGDDVNCADNSWLLFGLPAVIDKNKLVTFNETYGAMEHAFKAPYAHHNNRLHHKRLLSCDDAPRVLPFAAEVRLLSDMVNHLRELQNSRGIFTLSVREQAST